jgi:hypothetical protein
MTLTQRLSISLLTVSLAAPTAAATKWVSEPPARALVVAAASGDFSEVSSKGAHKHGPTVPVVAEPAPPTKLGARKPTSTDEARALNGSQRAARGGEKICSCQN